MSIHCVFYYRFPFFLLLLLMMMLLLLTVVVSYMVCCVAARPPYSACIFQMKLFEYHQFTYRAKSHRTFLALSLSPLSVCFSCNVLISWMIWGKIKLWHNMRRLRFKSEHKRTRERAIMWRKTNSSSGNFIAPNYRHAYIITTECVRI